LNILQTREAKLDEITEYLSKLDLNEGIIKIDIDESLKHIFESERDTFPILIRQCLERILRDSFEPEQAKQKASSYQIILKTNSIRKIRQIQVSELAPQVFDGIILGLGPRLQYIRIAHLTCLKGCEQKIIIDGDKELPERNCFEHDILMEIDRDKSEYDFVQRIVIQEPLVDAKNSNPIDYDCRIHGWMVDEVDVGQKKRLMIIPRRIFTKSDIANQAKILLDVISVMPLDEEKRILPSISELEDYEEQIKKGGWFNKIIESFAPDLIGEELIPIKKALLLSLVGSYKTDEDERADINVLLLGDPSVAKSSLLKYCQGICHKVIYTSGKGSSAAGLTIGMVKRHDGTSIAQAGILPLCNNGVALIDELDKMDSKDRSGLHEAMEQQTCSIAKAGTNLTLSSQTTVIAAANPTFGRWDPDKPILDNTELTLPLLSRFDIKFRMLDTVNSVGDSKKANHILNKYKDSMNTIFSKIQILSIINHSRNLRPKLSDNAIEKLKKYYVSLRAKDTKDIRIDTRTLKSLARLTIAHAKLHFKGMADNTDVEEIINIFEASLKSFGIDLQAETEQSTFFDSKAKQEFDVFNQVWQKVMNENQHATKPDVINELANTPMFDLDKSRKYFEKLVKQKHIIENQDGSFRRESV